MLAVLDADGRFNTFLRLALVEAPERFSRFLASPVWNNTLFAPTDDAFGAMPPGTLEYLVSGEPQAEFDLVSVIEHHVVDDVRPIDTFKPGEYTTISGTVEVTVQEGQVMLDGATVIEPNLKASNGMIHVIDRVLIPERAALG